MKNVKAILDLYKNGKINASEAEELLIAGLSDNECGESALRADSSWKNDKYYIGVFKGQNLLKQNEAVLSKFEVEYLGSVLDMECYCSIKCENIKGNAKAGGSISSGNIGGNANAGGSINSGDIGGSANTGGSLNAGDIGNNASAGGSLNASDIKGNAAAGGSITCNSIGGDAKTNGNIYINGQN